jgi:hypothetical protein
MIFSVVDGIDFCRYRQGDVVGPTEAMSEKLWRCRQGDHKRFEFAGQETLGVRSLDAAANTQ